MVILVNKEPCVNGISCDVTFGHNKNTNYRIKRQSGEFYADHASPKCKIIPDPTGTCKKGGRQYRYF